MFFYAIMTAYMCLHIPWCLLKGITKFYNYGCVYLYAHHFLLPKSFVLLCEATSRNRPMILFFISSPGVSCAVFWLTLPTVEPKDLRGQTVQHLNVMTFSSTDNGKNTID